MLRRLLQSLTETLPPSVQEVYTEHCELLIEGVEPVAAAQEVLAALQEVAPAHTLPEGFVATAAACLQEYAQNCSKEPVQLARSGVFWVSMGLLQIQLWMPQTIFDPALKRAYKLGYAQEEVGAMSLPAAGGVACFSGG